MVGLLGRGPVKLSKQDCWILAVIALSTSVIILFDANTKVGMAIGLLYVLPLMLTIWFRDWRVPALITLIMLGVAISVFFLKPPGDATIGMVNRPLIILAVGLTGALATMQVRGRTRLRSATAFNSRLLTESDHIVVKLDTQGNAVLFNAGASKSTGYSAEEVLGRNAAVLLKFADGQGMPALATTEYAGKQVDVSFQSKDGTKGWMSLRILPIEADAEEMGGLLLLGQDITARMKAETDLEGINRFLSHVLQVTPSILQITDLKKGDIIYENRNVAAVIGHPGEEVEAMRKDSYRGIIPADDAAVLQEGNSRLMAEKDGVIVETDYRMRGPDGKVRWFRGRSVVFARDAEGRPTQVMRVSYDITEMRQAQEKLSEEVHFRIQTQVSLEDEKERLAVTLRSIGDGVIATDGEGKIALMNPIAEALTGWPEMEAVGVPLMRVFDIFNEASMIECENPVEKVLRSGKVVGLANHTSLRARDGKVRSIADSGAPIRGKDGSIVGVILVFRDVTTERMVEEELTKAARLESVGMLAGGIAHDFNNILSGILGNVSMAMAYTEDERVMERLLQAESAISHAKRLSQQLLTFSSGGLPVKKIVDLALAVEQSVALALSGSNVAAEVLVDPGLCQVQADEMQVVQALSNIIINAKEAMPFGGKVQITATNCVPSDDLAAILPAPLYASISVRDQGKGIPSQNLKRIFEPYFTTKQHGQGLGLSVAYSIMDHHDGYIAVESEVGVGSCFTLYLPASAPEANSAALAEKEVSMSGRVLVMDDQEFILEVAGEMLMNMGFTTELAYDGKEAVDRYEAALLRGERFDAVIMDLTIPGGMGGREAVREILALDPEAKVLVSSGYSNDPVMAAPANYGFKGVVPKPYTLKQLRAEMQRLLIQ